MSQKGGTGKTSTALNLGVCLAEHKRRTLLIDLDPQANLTSGLGFNGSGVIKSISDTLCFADKEKDLPRLSTSWSHLELVPSSLDLAGIELESESRKEREWLLKKAVDKISNQYDYMIIDTPPSLGFLTQNALMTCNEILMPVQAHIYSMRAIPQLLSTIRVFKDLNSALSVGGILCTMFDLRNNLCRVVEEKIRELYGNIVFKTVIPMNIAIAESPAVGQPVVKYAPQSRGAKAYRQLAEEVMSHEQTG